MLLFILLSSLIVAAFTQDMNGTTNVVDTEGDLGYRWTVYSDRTAYADNFSQFIQEATELATKTSIEAPPADLANIEGFQGLWWTLWDGIYASWEGKAALYCKSLTYSIQYLSLRYALCGNSSITVKYGHEFFAIINNTKADNNVNFTCDGLMKQREFKLGGVYSMTIELNVYSDEEVKDQPGFALIDKISTTDDPPSTEGPRPSTTRHTWVTEPPTTPISRAIRRRER